MRYEDERWVKLYTRNTGTWVAIGWEGRFVLMSLLRIVDRAGVLDLIAGEEASLVADLISAPVEVVQIGLDRLLDRNVIVIEDSDLGSDLEGRKSDLGARGSAEDRILKGEDPIAIGSRSTKLLWPKFMEAQEAATSDKERQRRHRELASISHAPSRAVTLSHAPSRSVTTRRDETRRDESRQDETTSGDQGRIKALKQKLLAAYESGRKRKYIWGGARDTEALKVLVGTATDEQILAVWTAGCAADRGQGPTLSRLAKTWADRGPVQAELPAIPPAPPPPARAKSRGWVLYEDFIAKRQDVFEVEHEIPHVLDEPAAPAFVNTAIGAILKACGDSDAVVMNLFEEFFADPWASGLDPQWPFRAFASDKTWPRLLTAYRARVKVQAETPKPETAPLSLEAGGDTFE